MCACAHVCDRTGREGWSGKGVCREKSEGDKSTGMVKHRNRPASNHNPCPSCSGAPYRLQRQHLPVPDRNPCFAAGRRSVPQGSPTPRTPVSLKLPMGRANLLVPQCLFLTHFLAPLAVFPDLHPSCLPVPPLPLPRTVRCAVRYLVYLPYLSPACHLLLLRLSSHAPRLLWLQSFVSRLVLSRLVRPPAQWQSAFFVAGSPSDGHRGVLSDGVYVCVLCVAPRLSRPKKDHPFPGQALSCHLVEYV